MKKGDTVLIDRSRWNGGGTVECQVASVGSKWITVRADQRFTQRFHSEAWRDGSHLPDSGSDRLWPDADTKRRAEWTMEARNRLAQLAVGMDIDQLKAINAVVDLGAGEAPSELLRNPRPSPVR